MIEARAAAEAARRESRLELRFTASRDAGE